MSGSVAAPEARTMRARGFEMAFATRRGSRRKVNQDRARLCERGLCVIDGMGGGEAGEVFAELAANRVERSLALGEGPEASLVEASADLATLRRAVLRAPGGAMGCVCAFDEGGSCQLAALGDVRAFLVGEDDVEEVCELGASSRGYLGDGRSCAPRACSLAEKCLGSRVLLVCSDGFWRYVTARELMRIVRAAPSLEVAAVHLVGLARSCASPDDVTVALCRPLAELRGSRADTCPTVI